MMMATPRVSYLTMPSACMVLCATALLARQAIAHEHHEDKIPEGEAVSPDPIVYDLDPFTAF